MNALWCKFEQFHLTENMRLQNSGGKEEKEFAEYLLRIGDGRELPASEDESISSYKTAEIKVLIPEKFASTAVTVKDFCQEIYPNLNGIVTGGLQTSTREWYSWMMDRAIICPTNNDVNDINDLLIQQFPGEMFTYKSHDKLLTENEAHSFPDELLNRVQVNGVPPHLLQLKVGAPMMLLRNLDPTRGHVNGTRYIIKALNPRVIHAEIAIGPYKGKQLLRLKYFYL